MIVLGVDPHKYSHTVVAVEASTGRALGTVTVTSSRTSIPLLLEWAQQFDEHAWAIEDVRHVTRTLETGLVEAGERVVRVAPKLMAGARRSSRKYGKSDPIDAEAVARAAIRESLPPVRDDSFARDMKLLVEHRDDLVGERTRMQNRLRWHLHEIDSDWQIPLRMLSRHKHLNAASAQLMELPASVQVRVCRELVESISELTTRINALEGEIDELTNGTALRDIAGVGALTAALLIAETAGASIPSDAKLAMLAGTAPLDASSGRQQRHRLNRRGNRQLNRAIHQVALTQIRMHEPARAYVARRKEEGKTHKEAMRALKRYITRAIHHALANTSATYALTPSTDTLLPLTA